MVVALVLSLAAQAAPSQTANAEPIMLRHTRPAAEVTLNQSSTCGDQMFEISYVQTRQGVVGAIRVREGETVIELDTAQTQLFDRLSYIGGATVSCGDEELPSTILVAGTERETGKTQQLYTMGYLPSSGFSTITALR